MADHDGGVQIDHQVVQVNPRGAGRRHRGTGELRAGQPRPFPRPGPTPGEGVQAGLTLVRDRFEDPPARRRRCDLPVQPRLVGQHRDVGDRLTTVSDHHRQVAQHPARRVPATTLADPAKDRELLIDPGGQPDPIRQPAQQRGARVRHDPRAVSGHHQPRPATDTLHVESAFLLMIHWPSASQ